MEGELFQENKVLLVTTARVQGAQLAVSGAAAVSRANLAQADFLSLETPMH